MTWQEVINHIFLIVCPLTPTLSLRERGRLLEIF
jgi:hypothetical protein